GARRAGPALAGDLGRSAGTASGRGQPAGAGRAPPQGPPAARTDLPAPASRSPRRLSPLALPGTVRPQSPAPVDELHRTRARNGGGEAASCIDRSADALRYGRMWE